MCTDISKFWLCCCSAVSMSIFSTACTTQWHSDKKLASVLDPRQKLWYHSFLFFCGYSHSSFWRSVLLHIKQWTWASLLTDYCLGKSFVIQCMSCSILLFVWQLKVAILSMADRYFLEKFRYIPIITLLIRYIPIKT